MKIIYKYRLDDTSGTLKMPKGAKFLSVQTQEVAPKLGETRVKHTPHLWALIDANDKRRVSYQYRLIGTGWDIEEGVEEGYNFVGTVQIPDTYIGNLVFHLFVKEESR